MEIKSHHDFKFAHHSQTYNYFNKLFSLLYLKDHSGWIWNENYIIMKTKFANS